MDNHNFMAEASTLNSLNNLAFGRIDKLQGKFYLKTGEKKDSMDYCLVCVGHNPFSHTQKDRIQCILFFFRKAES